MMPRTMRRMALGRRILRETASPMKLRAMMAATMEKVIMTSFMEGSQSIWVKGLKEL